MFKNAVLEEGGKIISIHVPVQFKRRGGRKKITLPSGVASEPDNQTPTALQITIAKAFRWQKQLDSGEVDSVKDLINITGRDQSNIAKRLRLTTLAPDIVEAILDGNEPDGLSINQFFKPIPALWEEQRKLYGFIG